MDATIREVRAHRLSLNEASKEFKVLREAVFQIRIRIHRFLGLLATDPDPLVRGMDLDPSIIKQN